MRTASRALQYATLAAPAIEDGQESMKKLAFAPLGFLSLGGHASHVASILASAVAYLEGYGVDDLETDFHVTQCPGGKIVAHTELKLVPYIYAKPVALASPTLTTSPSVLEQVAAPKVRHEFSMSRVLLPAAAPDVADTFELERFCRSFCANALEADAVANDILLTTNSAEVATSVLQFAAQVGLTIPRSTLDALTARLHDKRTLLPHAILRQLQFEMNCGLGRDTSFFASLPPVKSHVLPKKRRQSKLERIRNAGAPH